MTQAHDLMNGMRTDSQVWVDGFTERRDTLSWKLWIILIALTIQLLIEQIGTF
jgi:hypothetical protein